MKNHNGEKSKVLRSNWKTKKALPTVSLQHCRCTSIYQYKKRETSSMFAACNVITIDTSLGKKASVNLKLRKLEEGNYVCS